MKDGVSTPDEEKQEPDYILYDKIAENTISILQLPTFEKGFEKLASKTDDETAQMMAEMMAVAMCHSSFSAIVFYDNLLKDELKKQFDIFSESLNRVIGTVNAHDGVMQIFKERLGKLEEKDKLKSLLNES